MYKEMNMDMAQQDIDQASIDEVDDYLSEFFEDNAEKKISSAKKILLLTMDLKNIDVLLNHESLLGTLSRVLNEDYKKNTELTTYLLCIFYIYSNYQQFHEVIKQNQIGNSTMQIIEFYIDKFDFNYSQFLEISKASKDYDKELKKINMMIAKQDKLFYMAINILLNIAIDPVIEKKMAKRKIVASLIRLLERNDFHLLIIILLFLRKLSIISENVLFMLELNLVEKLNRFFTCNNVTLLKLTLGIMKNICFNKDIRKAITTAGYIPKIVPLLNNTNFRFISIVLLYELSIDKENRDYFAYDEMYQYLTKLMLHFPEQFIGKELIALAINLSLNQNFAELVQEEDLKMITERALKSIDVSLVKFIKNLTISGQTNEIHETLVKFMRAFMKLALTDDLSDDLKIELIGIFSNIKLKARWIDFLGNQAFIQFLIENSTVGTVEDDIVLETIQLISSICLDEKCAQIMQKNDFAIQVCNILIDKAEDDEFIIQTLYALYQFLKHKICTDMVLQSEEIMELLLNNIHDKNPIVRKINDDVLDILREEDQELSERIKERKFEEHNKEWIESVQDLKKNFGVEEYNLIDQDYLQNSPYYQEQFVDEQQLDPKMWDSDSEY